MSVDIAIMTIREDEFKALRGRFSTERRRIPGGRTYLLGEVKTEKQTYSIAIARCGEQGNEASQKLAHYIIHNLDPQLILVVGIAGGVPREEFTLGDVVVSTRIVNPNVDAWHPDGTTDYMTGGGPSHPLVEDIVSLLPGEPLLADWADTIQLERPTLDPDQVNLTGDDNWQEQVRKSLSRHFGKEQNRGRPSTFTTGPILSSNHLMKDPARLREILKTHRSIFAVEMEVAGVYEAAQGIDHYYPVMAIRGISDIVGLQRESEWAEYACQAAAAFTYACIRADPLDPPLNRAPQKTSQEMIQEKLSTNDGIQVLRSENITAQFITTIGEQVGLEIARKVKNALDTYINTLLTDKNRIPLEFILAPDDRIKYDIVPLPAVFTELDVVYRSLLSNRSLGENDDKSGEEINSENKPIAAVQAVSEHDHIVIVGDPGAGKTTLINYLCVIMALILKGDQNAEELLSRESNGTWKANEILFPISIRLRDFGRSDAFREQGEGNAGNLVNYIADMVVGEHRLTDAGASIRSHVIDLLKVGGALVVMDGLDELPGETYEISPVGLPDERDHQQFHRKTARARMRLQRILNSFTEHPQYGQCRVVVTSRSYAYRTNAEWRLGTHFSEAHLRDFEPKQIQEYIRYWHIQIAKRRAKQNQIDPTIGPDFDEENIKDTVSSFWSALEKNKHMLELARRPLILTFIVSRFGMDRQVKSLPSVSKVNLYGEIVKMLTKFGRSNR